MSQPKTPLPSDAPEDPEGAPETPRHPVVRLIRIAVVLVIVGVAITAFASWYWTGDWTWMFNPQ